MNRCIVVQLICCIRQKEVTELKIVLFPSVTILSL